MTGSTTKWIAGLIVSALVGGFVAIFLEQPRLAVTILESGIDTEEITGNYVATPDEALVLKARGLTWLPEIPRRATIEQYVQYLEAALEQLKPIELDMQSLRESVGEWPSEFRSRGDYDFVFHLLRDNSALIMGHLHGQTRRANDNILGQVAEERLNSPGLYTVNVDDEGDYYVDHGALRVPVFWTPYIQGGEHREIQQQMAFALAYGLSHGDHAVIQLLRQEIDELLKEQIVIRDTASLMRREEERWGKVYVDALVVNNGLSTTAISPEARAYVSLNQFEFTDSNGEKRLWDANYQLDLQQHWVGEGPQPGGLTIEPGQALKVRFRSLSPVRLLPEAEMVLAAIAARSELARIGLVQVSNPGAPSSESRILVSDEFGFGVSDGWKILPADLDDRSP